jgi:membrane protease YdiL (CAAX protease family)
MRSLAIFLGLIAIALAAIAVLGYPAWLLTQSLGFEFRFHRVAGRVAMLVLLVGFVLLARRLRVADRASLGYALPPRRFLAEVARAMLLGALLMLPVLATMAALDMREFKAGFAAAPMDWVKLILAGAASGIVVAIIEETFLRGAMFTAISRESGVATAIASTSLLYAATHFFARFRVANDAVNPGSGVDMLAGVLTSFAHPLDILDAFLCLAAVGVVLGLVRHVTGNIAACIGLHAGWVMVIATVRQTSQPTAGTSAWLMSDYDGFIGWMVFGWTLAIGWLLWWLYRKWGHS